MPETRLEADRTDWLTTRAEMKYVVAAIYSNYSTDIVDDEGVAQTDAYTAPPQNDKLIIKLRKLEL